MKFIDIENDQFDFVDPRNQGYNKINELILQHLAIIREEIIYNLHGVIGLVLCGGFARGEGSVKNPDAPYFISDYDILVISNVPKIVNYIKSRKLEKRLSRLTGVWLVEIGFLNSNHIKNLPKRIFYYEVFKEGLCFYGSCNDLDDFSNTFNSSKYQIAIEDGLSVLFNRVHGLINAVYTGFPLKEPNTKQNVFLIKESSKAILSCVESILVLFGLYKPTYKERMQQFESLNSEGNFLVSINPDLVNLAKKALEWKLFSKNTLNIDPIEYWFIARDSLFKTLSFYIQKIKPNKNIDNFIADFYTSPMWIRNLRFLGSCFINTGSLHLFSLWIRHPVSNILKLAILSWLESVDIFGKVDRYKFEKCLSYLKPFKGIKEIHSLKNWKIIGDFLFDKYRFAID
jgi:predicted nucleotidyltransferase